MSLGPEGSGRGRTEDEPGFYRIRVAGRLGPEWAAIADGMTIDVHTAADGRTTTDLTGPIADQAALMGVLERLYTHGAKLLAVECLHSRQ